MRESIEEFGAAMICCIIGIIVIMGLAAMTAKGGMIAEFAEAYATYFYGAPQN